MEFAGDKLLPCRELAELASALHGLDDLADAPVLARRCNALCRAVATSGVGGRLATALVSGLNDELTTRVIALAARRHRLPSVEWCWLALGSEGRQEQTFVTDQDNGLVFQAADSQEAAALRALFLPFADDVNQVLAACGFELCSGRIMAGNPDWCLSLDEWRNKFIDWVRRPEPAALLNASIFFDLRPFHGACQLGEYLRQLLLGLTADTPSFLHMMAANALQAEVPLNFRSEIASDASGSIDLKKYGSRIFVDAARIFALATGKGAVNSSQRLSEAGPPAGLQADEIAAAEAALSHILRLRMDQQQADALAGRPAGHGLKPASLNDVDRAILRESLKQARRLQQRLKLNYAL